LFNGNPLLRFDGYYVLSDAIEIPNLATRAARYWGYLARRYLLGLGVERSPANATGERRWFLFYGAASTLYRLMISFGIALFLISTVPTLGVLLAAWLVAAQVLLPLVRQLHFLLFSVTLTGRRLRSLVIVGGLMAGLLGALALIPFPSSTKADGVVLLPEQAIVRAGVDGLLARQLVAYGSPVGRGDALFELSNPELERDLAVLRARITELAELARRRAGRVLRSPGAGVLRSPALGDRLGGLVAQGELLGYVADDAQAMVRVIAVQADAARIRDGVEAVHVRLADRASEILPGELLGEVPAASDALPSAALGSRAGGAIPVDARDPQGRQTLHEVFAFDIAVPYAQALQFIGSRAYVRFEHAPVPLLARGYDSVRRLVMSEIGE
jgi:putative peptide zinc metalloprotease protein